MNHLLTTIPFIGVILAAIATSRELRIWREARRNFTADSSPRIFSWMILRIKVAFLAVQLGFLALSLYGVFVMSAKKEISTAAWLFIYSRAALSATLIITTVLTRRDLQRIRSRIEKAAE